MDGRPLLVNATTQGTSAISRSMLPPPCSLPLPMIALLWVDSALGVFLLSVDFYSFLVSVITWWNVCLPACVGNAIMQSTERSVNNAAPSSEPCSPRWETVWTQWCPPSDGRVGERLSPRQTTRSRLVPHTTRSRLVPHSALSLKSLAGCVCVTACVSVRQYGCMSVDIQKEEGKEVEQNQTKKQLRHKGRSDVSKHFLNTIYWEL